MWRTKIVQDSVKVEPKEQEERAPFLNDVIEDCGEYGRDAVKLRKIHSQRQVLYATLICSLPFAGLFFFAGQQWQSQSLPRQCLEYSSMFSPTLEHMDPVPKMIKFNGTLGHQSEFTGEPSPELDAVWERWSYVKYASIPSETFNRLYNVDEDSSRFTPEYGGGYIGFLEVSHHMHCLNLLRMGIHQDYYMQEENKPDIFRDRPFTVKLHFEHCIEMLRQNIMCNADVGVIPHHWIQQSPDPFANFNTWHKCRDLDSVMRWIDENAIPDVPEGGHIPRPDGDKIWRRPP